MLLLLGYDERYALLYKVNREGSEGWILSYVNELALFTGETKDNTQNRVQSTRLIVRTKDLQNGSETRCHNYYRHIYLHALFVQSA